MQSSKQITKGQIEDFISNSTILSLALKEDLANKQNSLAVDGFGVKYPTVDATNAGLALKADDSLVVHKAGTETITGSKTFTIALNAFSFVKTGGTSGEFLKADGSIDNSVYSLDSSVVHLAGTETITGAKTFSTNTNIDTVTFNTSPSSSPSVEGRMTWDNASGTVGLRLRGNNISLPIGETSVYRIINKEGSNFLASNYQAVYVFGGQGHLATVKLARSNDIATSRIIAGIVAENINNNQEGFVVTRGSVDNINTSGSLQGESWVDGDIIYLSPTVFGGLTKVKPSSPDRVVRIGLVTNAHNTQGSLFVNMSQSLLLVDINDVLLTSIADEQLLIYDSGTGLWRNRFLLLSDLPVGTELISNKQNNLLVDGTGIKYPTVDAVNDEFDYVQSTGVLSGGILSINADPTKFDLSAGVGYVVNSTNLANVTRTRVAWNAFTAVTVTNLGTQLVTYISIDSSGNIFQQATFPTVTERRLRMIIGRINHATLTVISFVDTFPDMLQGPMSQYFDLTNAMGPFNISGNIISANGANLSINKSAGSSFNASFNYAVNNQSPNNIDNPGLTLVSFRHQNQNSTDGSNITVIDPTSYDVANVTTTVPNPTSTATAMRVYMFPSNQIRVQRGQATYANLAAAVSGYKNEVFIENPSNTGVAIWVATICVQKNCTSLLDTSTSRIIIEPKFGGSSGAAGVTTASLQSAYTNSIANPEILTSVALGAITARRGSAADTDTVLEVQNNAGTTNWSVTGNGVVTAASMIRTGAAATDALMGDGTVLTVSSGTYSPSLVNITNTTSLSATNATYMRIGNIVEVTVGVNFTPSAANVATAFTITLPFNRATGTPLNVGTGSALDGAVTASRITLGLQSNATTTTNVSLYPPTATNVYIGTVKFQYSVLD